MPATTTPRQADLLDLIQNPARVCEADLLEARALLKHWYPMSYNLLVEHEEMAAWLKEQGIEVEA